MTWRRSYEKPLIQTNDDKYNDTLDDFNGMSFDIYKAVGSHIWLQCMHAEHTHADELDMNNINIWGH